MTRLAERRAKAKAALDAARERRDTRLEHDAAERLKAATTAMLRRETKRPWWAAVVRLFDAAGMA